MESECSTMNNSSEIRLHYWACWFLSLENDTKISCNTKGAYLTGEQTGPNICIAILTFIYGIGLFGFFANILNVLVLSKTLHERASVSFKVLLIVLAVFDFIACFISIMYSTLIVVIKGNIDRSKWVIVYLVVSGLLFEICRTAEIYITLVITIERIFVVTFPIRVKLWLTPLKSKIFLSIALVLSIVLNLPWILNATVTENCYRNKVWNKGLSTFPFIVQSTSFGKEIYPLVRIYQLTFKRIPFLLLLVLNIFLYGKMYYWNRTSRKLSKNQTREIQVAKMFCISIFSILLCHTTSAVTYFTTVYDRLIYRELFFLRILSLALSASINFLIYYGFQKSFRVEVGNVRKVLWKKISGKK